MFGNIKCDTAYATSYFDLIKMNTGPFIQEFSNVLIMFQSVRNKALDIGGYIMQANVDLVFLSETWLRPEGDEADCAALTPPGFCLKSFPRQSGTCSGLAILHRTSQTENIAVSTRDFVFLLLRYVKCVFPMMVILQRSLVFTVPYLVHRIS